MMVDPNDPLPFQAHYLWIVSGLLLVVGEVLTGGFVLLWFAIGAFAAGLCAVAGASFNVQLIAFGVSSLLLFMASRTIFRTMLMRRGRHVPTNVDAMIGTEAEVLEEIGPDGRAGTVRIGGETWNAISAGAVLRTGTRVTIEAIHGLKLRVRAIEQDSPFAEAGRDKQ
jgi:membrane protein implicated in regulation of membrane protease activity